MKFFVDTADIADIRELNEAGLLDGVTTNPSLIHKSGRDFMEVTKEICGIVEGPVSASYGAQTSGPHPVVKVMPLITFLQAPPTITSKNSMEPSKVLIYPTCGLFLMIRTKWMMPVANLTGRRSFLKNLKSGEAMICGSTCQRFLARTKKKRTYAYCMITGLPSMN